jgi:hypothetical protein
VTTITTASRSYSVADVPPTGDDRSRFAIASSPGGHAIEPADCVALAANVLAEAAIREALSPPAKRVTVDLFRVALIDGEYVLVPAKSCEGEVRFAPNKPGRFVKKDLQRGSCLDSFLLRPRVGLYRLSRRADLGCPSRYVCGSRSLG